MKDKKIAKRKLQSIGIWVAVIILFWLFIWYNVAFIRTKWWTKLQATINPVPYTKHFDAEQERPKSFFTAPAFPGYTKWCHDNKKLCSIMPLQQLYADMQWISSIQYIWGSSNYKWFYGLHTLLDNISNLAPYWTYPYVFGELLIPEQKPVGADAATYTTIKDSRNKASELTQKGVYYTCDPEKIKEIEALSSSWFIETVYNTGLRADLENPCISYEIPYYGGFNEFYYKGDIEQSAKYYKVSAFSDGVPTMAPLMAALVYGRGGEHIKGATLRYERYRDLVTQVSSQEDEFIKADLEKAYKKSIFELQLQLITDAEQAAKDKGEAETCTKEYTCLQEKGYIKQTSENYFQECREEAEANTIGIKCAIFANWLNDKLITRNGDLTYPLWTWFDFMWDITQESRWINLTN